VYIADEMLRAEGFTDIRYVLRSHPDDIAAGRIDFDQDSGAWLALHLDAGEPLTVLAGLHPGCLELFAREPIRTISDLRGKKVGVDMAESTGHLYLVVMAAHVGLDPRRDIEWVIVGDGADCAELLATGRIDAFLVGPPDAQALRDRKIGHVILNITTDKPWSDYFCCMPYGNRAFVREHPVATKRYLRALLKAADFCTAEPKTVAQRLVDGKYAARYDYALQGLTEVSYKNWREFDPEDSLRFYALRLHEVGMIKSTPNKLIAEATDWRFLNEIKRELKA